MTADGEPLDETLLARIEASVRATAEQILAGFEREQIPIEVALAICGVVVGKLLDRSPPERRAEFIACLEDGDSA